MPSGSKILGDDAFNVLRHAGHRNPWHLAAARRAPRRHLRLRRLRPAAVRLRRPNTTAAPAGPASTSRSTTPSARSTDTSLGYDAHRSPLPPLRRPSWPRLRRRPAAHRPALLHEWRGAQVRAQGRLTACMVQSAADPACATRIAQAISGAMKLTIIQTGDVPAPLRDRVRPLSPDVPAHVRRGRGRSTTTPCRIDRWRAACPIRQRSTASSSPARRPASTTPLRLDGAAARLHPRGLCRQDPDARHLLRPPDHGRRAGRRRAQVRKGLGPRPPRLRRDSPARLSSAANCPSSPSPARIRTR